MKFVLYIICALMLYSTGHSGGNNQNGLSVNINENNLQSNFAAVFVCGEVDGLEGINILDIVFLVNYKYKNGPAPDPYDAGDVNGNPPIDILDIVYLVNFLYKNGPILNCPPPIPVDLEIGPGTDVVINGLLQPGEWDDANEINFGIQDEIDISVKVKHANGYLLASYTYNFIGEPNLCFPEICIDPDNEKGSAWDSNDWWFHVSGTDCEAQGTYFVWGDCTINQPDWWGVPNFALVSDPPILAYFEMKIPFSKLGVSVGDSIGILFDVESIPTHYGLWPEGASMDSPQTWGTAELVP
ncbi:MAG: hypothetical protein GY865_18995 [candidate division Zixibacteria bacterium]|nr:hypothetical protein [candidate division Zixibacteria bacterium]